MGLARFLRHLVSFLSTCRIQPKKQKCLDWEKKVVLRSRTWNTCQICWHRQVSVWMFPVFVLAFYLLIDVTLTLKFLQLLVYLEGNAKQSRAKRRTTYLTSKMSLPLRRRSCLSLTRIDIRPLQWCKIFKNAQNMKVIVWSQISYTLESSGSFLPH
jgi:hypothetical protein